MSAVAAAVKTDEISTEFILSLSLFPFTPFNQIFSGGGEVLLYNFARGNAVGRSFITPLSLSLLGTLEAASR